MGQRFADLIIVEGLDQFVENTSDSSFFMRLTYLLEDTRQFIHSSTKDTEHGHHCGLIVSSSLTKSCIQKNPSSKLFPQLPAHALRKTYLLQEQNEINCFQLHSVEDSWKLNLKRQSDEIFWISDH
ncbi:unnamed protein product [Heterobilharzia americana]|nr:unnamed protein product [Heterobilharzia americana]